MLIFGRAFSLSEISLMTEIQAVAEHYCTSIRDLTGITPEFTCSKAGYYKISIPTRADRLKILEFFGYTGKEAGYMFMFTFFGVAYLIGWVIMKVLVPRYKKIEL